MMELVKILDTTINGEYFQSLSGEQQEFYLRGAEKGIHLMVDRRWAIIQCKTEKK